MEETGSILVHMSILPVVRLRRFLIFGNVGSSFEAGVGRQVDSGP